MDENQDQTTKCVKSEEAMQFKRMTIDQLRVETESKLESENIRMRMVKSKSTIPLFTQLVNENV